MITTTVFHASEADFGERLLKRTIALTTRIEANRKQLEQRILHLRQPVLVDRLAGQEMQGRM